MQCSIGFLLKLSGVGYRMTRDVSSRLYRIEFRRLEVFGLKSFAGTSIPILIQVTLLHEALTTSSDLWWKGHRRGQGSNPRLGLNFSGLSHSAKNAMIKFIHSNPHFKYMDNSCIIIAGTLSQGRMLKN